MTRVVVTGLGVRTPLGDDPQSLWRRLLAGECAARDWDDLREAGFPVVRACRIAGSADAPADRRGRLLAHGAARQAAHAAGLPPGTRTGVFVGTTMGESAGFEGAGAAAARAGRAGGGERGHGAAPAATDGARAASGSGTDSAGGGGAGGGPRLDLEGWTGQAFAAAVAAALGLDGPQRTYGTACAAGNYAIGAAADAVRSGEVAAALAGGVEPFSRIAMLGFARLRAMAAGLCRPFDAARSGMQLGEAAAFLLLEREGTARARGAPVLAAVHGLGLSGDAYHPTAPRPDGSGMAAAMERALAQAGIAPADVGWVCAHGTGTQRSDAAEALALHRVFGDRPPPVSGLKGALGHTLGAATAVEAVASVLALRDGLLPPTANLERADPDLDLDVVARPREAPGLRWTVSCGYAFGGLNSALLLEAA